MTELKDKPASDQHTLLNQAWDTEEDEDSFARVINLCVFFTSTPTADLLLQQVKLSLWWENPVLFETEFMFFLILYALYF